MNTIQVHMHADVIRLVVANVLMFGMFTCLHLLFEHTDKEMDKQAQEQRHRKTKYRHSFKGV
jgi:hypothetical protein